MPGSKHFPRLSEREYRATLPQVETALAQSDEIILGRFRRPRMRRKPDGSEVTDADRGAEQRLRQALRTAWPADPILGEEFGGELMRHGRCWLLDPIDGTASYVLGVPMFGTLISLLLDGQPVFGCIHLPALRETTLAAIGFGCWFRREGQRLRRVRVGPVRALRHAQIGLTSFKQSDLQGPPGPLQLGRLLRSVGHFRLVGDCVQYTLLCRGLLDAAVDPKMNPWDIGALVPCVLEAGGSVSGLSGRTNRIVEQRSFVAASSARLRRAICRQVSG